MEKINVPLTAYQVENLTMQKRVVSHDKRGNPIMGTAPAFVHEYPNRQSRRLEKQTISSKNRKNTKGRHAQFVDITIKQRKPFGVINVATGYVKKIVHHPVIAKIINSTTGK